MKKKGNSLNEMNKQISFDFVTYSNEKKIVNNVLNFESNRSQRSIGSNSDAIKKIISHAKSLNW